MAKGKLEFDLNDPDEKMAFTRASKSLEAYLAILDLRNFLFEGISKSKLNDGLYEEILNELQNILDGYGIDLDRDLN